MAKSEMDELTDETVGRGGILAKLYFDMESDKKEELQPLMTDLINNRLLKSAGVVYCFGAINDPVALGKSYSTSAAVTCLFKDLGSIVNVAFNFAPAAIEILRPERDMKIRTSELQAVLLDVSQVSVSYSQYILSRVLSKEDYEKVMKDMKNREELGKKVLGEKKQ